MIERLASAFARIERLPPHGQEALADLVERRIAEAEAHPRTAEEVAALEWVLARAVEDDAPEPTPEEWLAESLRANEALGDEPPEVIALLRRLEDEPFVAASREDVDRWNPHGSQVRDAALPLQALLPRDLGRDRGASGSPR